MDLATILAEVNALPVEDRLRLVDQIWDGLDEMGYIPELSPEFKAELDRRLDHLDKNPNDVIPWEEVEARLRSRLGSK